MLKTQLAHISNVQLGAYAQPTDHGDTAYLLVKNFDESGRFQNPDSFIPSQVVLADHFLRDGDVLLTAKGYRNFAWTYRENIGPAIASSAFFRLRPRTDAIIPEYLAMILNTPQSRNWLQMIGGGNSVPSIRKSEMESIEVTLPRIDTQRKIVELKILHDQEMILSQHIMEQKEKLFQSAINKLLSQES
jgi:restriction endonuclease S subunit